MTGIDRNRNSQFRRRSRQRNALNRLNAQLAEGRKFVPALNTHADLTEADRTRIGQELDTLYSRVG